MLRLRLATLFLACVGEALLAAPRRTPSLLHRSVRAFDQETDALRLATLVTVPMCWGTYSPVVKYVYELPAAPSGILFSAVYYVVAFSTLSAAKAVLRADAADEELANRAGLELGGYLFLGNAAQVVGLESTTADAAAFLIQTTTVFVPALQALTRGSLPTRTLIACAAATAGVAVICAGEGQDLGDMSRGGDALVVLAAVFYSLHVIRLGEFAPRLDALDLAASKAKFETLFAIASAAAFTPLADLRATLAAPALGTLALAALWCGTVVCAYTIWAQSFGQRAVPPARANLIYTSQPLFSAAFAAILVGERPTEAILLGGGLIILAILTELDVLRLPAR